MFVHLDYLKEEVDLQAEMIEGTRFYRTPSGKLYPSITSVTSFYGRKKFIEWRKKVGEEEANKITKVATEKGTKFHDIVEKYLLKKTARISYPVDLYKHTIDPSELKLGSIVPEVIMTWRTTDSSIRSESKWHLVKFELIRLLFYCRNTIQSYFC